MNLPILAYALHYLAACNRLVFGLQLEPRFNFAFLRKEITRMKKHLGILFIGLFTLTLLTVTAGQAHPPAVATAPATVQPVPRLQSDWWKERHAAKSARVAQGNVDLLFLGDSITHSWENSGRQVWDQYYAKRNAANLGFSGDRTQHVLWRLLNSPLENISPKLAVLMIGTNNANTDSPEDIAKGVEAIVTLLGEKLPETKVLVLAIFPRGPDSDAKFRKVNEAANAIIKNLEDNKRVYYLDIGPKFLTEDGVLTKEIMPDFLHPHEKGYAIWAEAIEPTIRKLLGEK